MSFSTIIKETIWLAISIGPNQTCLLTVIFFPNFDHLLFLREKNFILPIVRLFLIRISLLLKINNAHEKKITSIQFLDLKKKKRILPLFLLTMYDSVLKNIKFFLFFLYEIFGPHGRIDR